MNFELSFSHAPDLIRTPQVHPYLENAGVFVPGREVRFRPIFGVGRVGCSVEAVGSAVVPGGRRVAASETVVLLVLGDAVQQSLLCLLQKPWVLDLWYGRGT